MAIIVEDGSVVLGANSYVSEADLTAYAAARGVALTAGTEQLLIQSMDYIESRQYQGTKSTNAQPLQWPRFGVFIDGWYQDQDEIPQLLQDSEMETAIAIDGGDDPMANQERETIRERVDVLEVEYAPGARATTYLTAVETKITKLLAATGAINTIAMRG